MMGGGSLVLTEGGGSWKSLGGDGSTEGWFRLASLKGISQGGVALLRRLFLEVTGGGVGRRGGSAVGRFTGVHDRRLFYRGMITDGGVVR